MKQVISKDQTVIAYDEVGNGKPLIYISGAICHRKFMPIVDDVKVFRSRFKVISYDRRGRGDSTDTRPYSPEKELADLEALLHQAGGKACLYGHSSGGILALEAALAMPEKIEKILIYDPAYLHREDEKPEYLELERRVRSLLRDAKHAKALKTFLVGIGMPRLFVHLLPLMPGWKKLKALAPTLEYDLELTKVTPPYERLSRISVPLKIVCGSKSPRSIREASKQIAQAIPHSQYESLEGQDHMVSAKRLLPVLVDFFD